MKEYAERFYSSKAWKECRKAYRKKVGGLCERCLKEGRISAGVIVHHKIYVTPENINRPDIILDGLSISRLFNAAVIVTRRRTRDAREDTRSTSSAA